MKPKMTPEEALTALANMTDVDFPNADLADDIDEAMAVRLVEAGRKAAGRPSLTAPGTHSPQITLRLPQSVNQRLAEVAERTGRRRSQVIRDALDEYLTAA